MNWLFSLARVIGAGIPFGGVLVQVSAEWDAHTVQQRLQKLEDPISVLHPDVRQFSEAVYGQIRMSNQTQLQFSEEELARYARVIAILEHAGQVCARHALGRQHPVALWIEDSQYLLYMAALFEDPDAMGRLVNHVDACIAGSWLRGADLAAEYELPVPVVRAVFQMYAGKGLGILSREVGVTNYMCRV